MPAFKPLYERYDIAENGCWLWNSHTDKDGYGCFTVNKKNIRAHRYIYEFWYSTRIPPEMVIDHLCNRKRCVNPAHMRVTTHRENILRSKHSLAAINARKTECKNGHPFSGDNLHIRPGGGRDCKMCKYLRQKASYSKYDRY